jgi:peptide/nickel transport system permease protein
MISYAIRRIAATIPVLLGILVVTFVLARLIPADPCVANLGERATEEMCKTFLRNKGLDKPIYVQLGIYMRDFLTEGDLGTSIRYSRPVVDLLTERLPMTLELSLSAFVLAVLLGIPAGIVSARYHNSFADVGTMIGANIGVSMPVFWLGLMLATLFAVVLKGTPFYLPPSNRLSAGITITPFYELYNWPVVEGTGWYNIVRFVSNMYLF